MNVNMVGQTGLGATTGVRQAPPPQAVQNSVVQDNVVSDRTEDNVLAYGEVSENFLENLIASESGAETGGDGILPPTGERGEGEAMGPGGAGDRPPPPPPGGEGPKGAADSTSESESIVLSLLEDAAAMNQSAIGNSSAYAEELYATTQEMLIAAGD